MKKEQTGMKEANRTCKMKNIIPEIENFQDKFNSTLGIFEENLQTRRQI